MEKEIEGGKPTIVEADDREIILEAKDKEDILNEFNKRGYILEDTMIDILSNHIEKSYWMSSGQIGVEYARRNDGERVEIDAILRLNAKTIVAEAKRTEFDWIFSPSLHRPKDIVNLIAIGKGRDHHVKTMKIDEGPIKIAYHDFAIEFDEDKLYRNGKNEKLSLPHSFRPIHDAMWQVLKETKAVILEGEKYIPGEYSLVIPIIVTNARLLFLDYHKEDIAINGDLKSFSSIKEVKSVGVNFHEYLGFNTEQGLHSSKLEGVVKTIFIINIKYLKEVIEFLSTLYPVKTFDNEYLTSRELQFKQSAWD